MAGLRFDRRQAGVDVNVLSASLTANGRQDGTAKDQTKTVTAAAMTNGRNSFIEPHSHERRANLARVSR